VSALRVELLSTGSELLLGEVRDSHLSWFGRKLFALGLRIGRHSIIPDGSVIRDAMLESFSRSDLLIVTGGLGPTTDDITREITAELLGLRLQVHEETMLEIQNRCLRRGYVFQERMARQAMVPSGAEVLPNHHGTAPGLYLPPRENISWSTPHLFLLPGPPRELQPMAEGFVLPIVARLNSNAQKNECRIYRVVGMGESLLEEKIGFQLSLRSDLEVGYCARPNEVDFRLIGSPSVLAEVEPLLLEILGDHLVSTSDESLEHLVVRLLSERSATLATAESCTGGLLANRLTNVPGSSEIFLEGFVTYSNQSKSELLGVSPELIDRHGAVSAEVVRAMAGGARERSGADYSLATTGIAGPGGGGAEKPVGTVWLALSEQGRETQVWKENFSTDRLNFKQLATQSALNQLRLRLLAEVSNTTAS
jgi:nicotinamide-nucleotide amidase